MRHLKIGFTSLSILLDCTPAGVGQLPLPYMPNLDAPGT